MEMFLWIVTILLFLCIMTIPLALVAGAMALIVDAIKKIFK
jgi:hypothetical protein